MKKMFAFLMIVGLGCFTIGCNGDPGVSEETEITETDETENLDMSDPTAGLEGGGDEAPPEAGGGGGDEAPPAGGGEAAPSE